MKLHNYAAMIVSSAILVSQVPAIAQSTAEMDKSMKLPTAAESTPMAPALEPTMAAPAAPTPTMDKPASTLPTLESTPAPVVSTTSMPTAVGPAPAAMTQVLPQETITGIPTVSLPEPLPIRPAYFTLPIITKVAQDSSATSTTPISDRYTGKANWNLEAWLAGVRGCMAAQPKLMRVVGDQSVPFMLNGQEGTIMLNSENRPVCPVS
jgi:hypothetical protein